MTAQIPERIKYEGKEHILCSEPLEGYFSLGGRRPPQDGRCTACRRGYVSEWEIREDRLYLRSIHDLTSSRDLAESSDHIGAHWYAGTFFPGKDDSQGKALPLTLERIFPGYPDRVFAHWYTGTLRIPQGKLLRERGSADRNIYESDVILNIAKGIVVGKLTRDNSRR